MSKRVCLKALSVAVLLLLLALPSAALAETQDFGYHVVTTNGTVCLTVDDGFGRWNRLQILSTLRQYNVKCTFFVVGDALMRDVDVWRQAIQEGHEICYHSMHHRYFPSMSDAEIQRDIDDWRKTMARVLPGYYSPRLARFPGGNGARDPRIMRIFARNGFTVIGWSVQNVSEKNMAGHMKACTKSNSIILIHFDPVNVRALPRYIGYLKSHFKMGKVSASFPQCLPTPKPAVVPGPAPGPVVLTQ